MKGMIEFENKGIRGRLKRWNNKRREEKQRIRSLEEKFEKRLEGKFIKRRVEARLRQKYAPKPRAFLWELPKQGQRSAGQSILEGISGAPPKKKR